MDGRERIAGTPGVPVALPPDARYAGADGSGRVRVEIDGTARDAAVVLEPGWRSTVGTDGLGAAVLEAVSAATSARLTAWAAPAARAQPPTRSRIDRPGAETVSRAWHELRGFRQRLTTLHATTERVRSPRGMVVVTVAAGRLAAVEIDPIRQRAATTRDLEHHIGHALRTALALIAALPERALDGFPALHALLAGTPFAPDSTEAPR